MPGFLRRIRNLTLTCATAAIAASAYAQDAKLYVTSDVPIILGEAETVSLVIEVPETPDTEGRPLQVTANVGRIDPPERVGPGKYRATYYPPKTKFPQSAIIAAWRETGPDARVDFLRIPLSARTKLPFKGPPNAQVRVIVGGDTFGPETADRKGNTAVPIIVPPGVREVVVETTDRNANRKRSTVPVKVPNYNRLAIAVTPYMTEGKSPVTVHVYYDNETSPPPADRVRLTVPGGTSKPQGATRNRYRFEYKPAPNTSAREVTLTAGVTGDERSTASSSLLIGRPVAERMLSRTSSTSLMANGAATKLIRALVIDHYGLGVEGLPVRATVSSGKVATVIDMGGGYYETVVTAPTEVPPARRLTVELAVENAAVSGRIDVPLVAGGGALAAAANAVGGGPAGGATTETEPAIPRRIASLAIGARLGGAYDAQVAPLLGVEVSYRPNVANKRLAFFVGAEFRTMSKTFTGPQLSSADSSLQRLPIFVGLTYDLVARNQWRAYGGAAGGLVGVAHRIETDFQDPQVFRRVVPGAQVLGGAAYGGVFLELAATFMSISDRSLELPSTSVSASLGYRLGLF